MEEKKKKTAIKIAGAVLLVCMAGAFWLIKEKETPAAEGQKEFTVEVYHKDGSRKEFSFAGNETSLSEVLQEEGLIEGEAGPYGLFVDTVDGEETDYTRDGSWWSLSVNGTEASTGIDGIVITDGDLYTWTYMQP